MADLPDWLKRIMGIQVTAPVSGTPPYVPQQNPGQLPIPRNPIPITKPGEAAPQSGGIPQWLKDLLPTAVGAGLNITGAALDSRARGNANEAVRERTAMMDKLAREETARRDYFARALMPNLLRGTGFSKAGIAENMRNSPLMAGAPQPQGTPGPPPPLNGSDIHAGGEYVIDAPSVGRSSTFPINDYRPGEYDPEAEERWLDNQDRNLYRRR